MAKSVKLQVITPSKMFYSGDIELVIVKTLSGEEGFMAEHAWACKLLAVGGLWIQEAGAKEFRAAAVSGGFIDVKDDFIIYTDAAEWASDIDVERALSEKAKAEDWLTEHRDEDTLDVVRAKVSIAKQAVRMNLAKSGARRKR